MALRIDDERTAHREFGDLLKLPDNYPKYVITAEGFSENTHEGIHVYSIREFLTNF